MKMAHLIFLIVALFLIGGFVFMKFNIALSIFILAILTGIFKRIPLGEFFLLFYKTLTHFDTINMILVIIIVTYLAELLKVSGFLDDVTNLFKSIFPPRVYLPAFSMIIGLLPMPGGALVSAPMVEEGATYTDLKEEEKALLNFWFRHVWEPISPLYPEFLLGVSILGTTIGKVISIQWPVTFGMFLSGVIFILPKINSKEYEMKEKLSFLVLWKSIKTLSPILFIFAILLTFKHLPSFVAMLSGVIYIIIFKKVTISNLLASSKWKKILEYAFLIYAIFLLREIISSTQFASHLYTELKALSIPYFLTLFLLPFSIGFLAGISSASIGIAYPLLMPLLKENGVINGANLLIAYMGVWTALLFTPTHLCLSLSVDYFKAKFPDFYRLLLLPYILLLLVNLMWVLVLR